MPAYGSERSAAAGRDRTTSSPRAAAVAATASSSADLPIPSGPCNATPPPAASRASTAASSGPLPNRVAAAGRAPVSRAVSPGES
ncbi:hypothetical protein CLV70_101288 [Pseudosporangium ferrugineum]|uniref:Uncharacterized protein n=1 Tax=Pseudosporangium ferrugineum TaxID=439699 RepID=A0A2T0SIB9_9ACTN|nr:hypothetical protein CLV70_101288 [Pseudosporangium ferrugineum]